DRAAGHPGSGTRLKPSYFHILSIGICSAAELAARATRYRCPLTTSDSLHRDKPAPLRLVFKATRRPTLLEPSEGQRNEQNCGTANRFAPLTPNLPRLHTLLLPLNSCHFAALATLLKPAYY